MTGGAQVENPASRESSGGAGILWFATVVVSLVAALATWFAVAIVYDGSRHGSGSNYIEGGGWAVGVVAGLLVAAAALLLFYTVTGHTPSERLMGAAAVAILVLMQVALFIAGEYGEDTAFVPRAHMDGVSTVEHSA